ncbi:MAG TPA: hypothetical protein VG796_11990 [Verrucomicrobiales bacterium]|nr:hypothetical protein [Verrucomicrobiales bacterium]
MSTETARLASAIKAAATTTTACFHGNNGVMDEGKGRALEEDRTRMRYDGL